MSKTLSKFLAKEQSSTTPQNCSISIDIVHQGKTLPATIHLITSKNSISFTISEQLLILRNQCKMVPLFVETQGKTLVQQIYLYDPQKLTFCLLRCKNVSETEKVYQKLKRCISHKGFNQFYKPLKRLGRGTFATVYLIEHKYTKVRRAAKVFSNEGQKIEFKGKEALQNEIKTLREIDHPNLIKYDGLYETDNLIYLVTEYLSGGTLDDVMKNKMVHTGQYVSKIIKDCLEGLNYLDQKQIMHRDIKPQNIIYRKEEDQWVLSDFGLAAKSNEDYLYDKCGTMGYIAPQIMDLDIQNPKKYSQQCDIYSLGIIAYTLIIGSLPFRVQSENFFDKKLVWDMFDKPQCKELHPQVLKFLKKLLQRSPQKRYTAKQALQSPFFKDSQVVEGLYEYHERRRKQRYDKILKIANIQL